FFQAEDGIRDFHVTGVQTCALPIWVIFGGVRAILTDDDRVRVARDAFAGEIDAFRFESGVALFHDSLGTFAWSRGFLGRLARLRSEERRGGREREHGRGAEQDRTER